MFARESNAVSPRLGDTNLVSSERTLNSFYALFRESIGGIGYSGGSKVSSRVCNLYACRKVAWRSDTWFHCSSVRRKLWESRSRRCEVVRFNWGYISKPEIVRTTLRTKPKITLKVLVATATVTATTAVAQGVRTR